MGKNLTRSLDLIEEFTDFLEKHVEATREELDQAREDPDASLQDLLNPQTKFAKDVNSRFAKMKNQIAEIHGL